MISMSYTGPRDLKGSNRPHSALNPTQLNKAQKVTVQLDLGGERLGWGENLTQHGNQGVGNWAMEHNR